MANRARPAPRSVGAEQVGRGWRGSACSDFVKQSSLRLSALWSSGMAVQVFTLSAEMSACHGFPDFS